MHLKPKDMCWASKNLGLCSRSWFHVIRIEHVCSFDLNPVISLSLELGGADESDGVNIMKLLTSQGETM